MKQINADKTKSMKVIETIRKERDIEGGNCSRNYLSLKFKLYIYIMIEVGKLSIILCCNPLSPIVAKKLHMLGGYFLQDSI